ncbi:MAG: ABC transporter permease [Phycisphaerales bacterium JB063]
MTLKPAPPQNASKQLFRRVVWPLAAVAFLLLINLILNPGFYTLEFVDGEVKGAVISALRLSVYIMLPALGMCLVIATRGVDLSVGTVAAIGAAVTAWACTSTDGGSAVALSVAGVLGAGLLCGLFNGMVISKFGIQPIVATLAFMVAGRGIARLIMGNTIQLHYEHPTLDWLGNGALLGLPTIVWVGALIAGLLLLLVRGTALGMLIEATGDNPQAARLVGVPVARVLLLVYVLAAVLSAIAGLLWSGEYHYAHAVEAGKYWELDAIMAVVIGGTMLTGGRFTLLGTILGALLIQLLTQMLMAMGVDSAVTPLYKGVIVLAICLIQAPAIRQSIADYLQRRRELPA